MRILRLLLAGLVIVAAGFVIAGEQLSGTSADAVINARLTTVRAPTAGQLTLEHRLLGSSVAEGEQLGSIDDPLVDNIYLNDMIREKAFATAEVDRLSSVIGEIGALSAAADPAASSGAACLDLRNRCRRSQGG